MPSSSGTILTTILLTPLAAAITLCFLSEARTDLHRKIAGGFAALNVIFSLVLLWRFETSTGAARFQFVADHSWIPSLGVRYTLGIDGISLLMVILTTVLGLLVVTSIGSEVRQYGREYYAAIFATQVALLGVFLSLDFVLFYFFWTLTLLVMYFLIAVWGGERRFHSALRLLLGTLAGSVAMLLAILAIGHARNTFDVRELLSHPIVSQWRLEKWSFWGFFLSFAALVPMFPFHSWMPDVHPDAPPAVSAILSGLLLNVGAYGFLRFSIPMLPAATNKYRGLMMALSVIAIIYGALASLVQTDIKRFIGYASFSQMGFCTLGIFVLNPLGLSGGAIQQVSEAILLVALFLLASALYERGGTTSITAMSGVGVTMPRFAVIYTIITLAAAGIPLLCGFTGQFTVLRGVVEIHWFWAACALTGVVVAAGALLWLYQRLMFGRQAGDEVEKPADLSRMELAYLVPLAAFALWIGVYPKPLFNLLASPVKETLMAVHPVESAAAKSAMTPVAPRPVSEKTSSLPADEPRRRNTSSVDAAHAKASLPSPPGGR